MSRPGCLGINGYGCVSGSCRLEGGRFHGGWVRRVDVKKGGFTVFWGIKGGPGRSGSAFVSVLTTDLAPSLEALRDRSWMPLRRPSRSFGVPGDYQFICREGREEASRR